LYFTGLAGQAFSSPRIKTPSMQVKTDIDAYRNSSQRVLNGKPGGCWASVTASFNLLPFPNEVRGEGGEIEEVILGWISKSSYLRRHD
jgi:hypothetical protein